MRTSCDVDRDSGLLTRALGPISLVRRASVCSEPGRGMVKWRGKGVKGRPEVRTIMGRGARTEGSCRILEVSRITPRTATSEQMALKCKGESKNCYSRSSYNLYTGLAHV